MYGPCLGCRSTCCKSQALGIVPSSEAPYASDGDGISNINVPRVDQDGSSLSFSVTWADGGGAGGTEDTAQLVDIWLSAKQYDPQAWVELPVQEVCGLLMFSLSLDSAY